MSIAANLNGQSVITRNSSVIGSESDNELMMMDINSGKYFSLELVGLRIWALLENSISLNDIISSLQEEFEVDAETCEQDVRKFIVSLAEKNLVSLS